MKRSDMPIIPVGGISINLSRGVFWITRGWRGETIPSAEIGTSIALKDGTRFYCRPEMWGYFQDENGKGASYYSAKQEGRDTSEWSYEIYAHVYICAWNEDRRVRRKINLWEGSSRKAIAKASRKLIRDFRNGATK